MQKKLFLAVPCPVGTQSAVRSVIDELAQTCPCVRWNRDENLHVTLAFLGMTDDDRVSAIVESMRSVTAAWNEFVIEVTGVGAFPNNEEPVTVWAGVGEGIQKLKFLQRTIVEQLGMLGFEPEARPYRPHLTLGRLLDSSHSATVSDGIASGEGRRIGPLIVSDVVLYSSETTDNGPTYEALATLPITTSRIDPAELVGAHIQGVVSKWHIHRDSKHEGGFYLHMADGRFIEAYARSGLTFRRRMKPEDYSMDQYGRVEFRAIQSDHPGALLVDQTISSIERILWEGSVVGVRLTTEAGVVVLADEMDEVFCSNGAIPLDYVDADIG